MSKEKGGDGILGFLRSDRGLLLLLWLLCLAARLWYYLLMGFKGAIVNADGAWYLESGMEFARSGRITYWGYPTAMIMPGIVLLPGILAKLFVTEEATLAAAGFVWLLIGSFTPLFYYKAVRLFTPKWCAFLAGLVGLMPWLVQIDLAILTEGPYYLFFAMALYYTLKMGEDTPRRYMWRYAFSVLGALMFRANILSFVVFTFLYLLLKKKYSLRELGARLLILAGVLALLIVPWTIRNYRVFHDFIPITYGTGSPLLEGTYQGIYYPSDEELQEAFGSFDAEAEMRRLHPDLFDESGALRDPEMDQYYRLLRDGVLARFRIRGWWKLHPWDFIRANLYVKPRASLNNTWYYGGFPGLDWQAAHRLRQANLLLCVLGLILAFPLKKHRKVMAFLALAYAINFLLVTATFFGDRYAQMVMAYRYVAAGISLDLIAECFRRRKQKTR